MTPTDGPSDRPIILLVAPRPVRRAMLDAFLADWARSNGVSTLSVAVAPRGLAEAWCMAVVDLCSYDIEHEGPMRCVHALRQNAPDLPIAVLSDDGEPRSAAAAIRLGLRAYVPTALPAHIALCALTLVLKGGDYFPPTFLLERQSRSGSADFLAPSTFDAAMQSTPRG